MSDAAIGDLVFRASEAEEQPAEASPPTSLAHLTKTDKFRQAIISGRTFNPHQLAAEVGGHNSNVYRLRTEAEVLGYIFRYSEADNTWQCLNPGNEPTKAHHDRLREHRRKVNPGAYGPKPTKAKPRAPVRPYSPEEQEAHRLASKARLEAREERERQGREAAANGHNLSLFADPGASMMGMPFDAELRSIANGNGNGSSGMLATPPQLGGQVQVFAMVIRDDGTLRLGLQTGERRWMVDVVGEMAR